MRCGAIPGPIDKKPLSPLKNCCIIRRLCSECGAFSLVGALPDKTAARNVTLRVHSRPPCVEPAVAVE
jgi:hypothetical protein